MTYNQKKSLYESIMKDVAKTVKRQINEANIREMKLSDDGYIGLLTRGLDSYLKSNGYKDTYKNIVELTEEFKNDPQKQQKFFN